MVKIDHREEISAASVQMTMFVGSVLEVGRTYTYMESMEAWTRSAMDGYYRNPQISFLKIGARPAPDAPVTIAGYYIVPHCAPDCCALFGSVSKVDFGPFPTLHQARQWSRENLVDPG